MKIDLYEIVAYPEIGEGDAILIPDIGAPEPKVAHEVAKANYSMATGVPMGLVHTKLVARKTASGLTVMERMVSGVGQ